MVDSLVTIGLATLFLMMVACATPLKDHKLLNREWILRLVPRWNFFAPVPGTYGYHLLFRTQGTNGVAGTWREVEESERVPRWWSPIWNPDKGFKKGFFDLASILQAEDANAKNVDLVKLSLPYIALLSLVSDRARTVPGAIFVQFVVVRTQVFANTDTDIIITSGLHALNEGADASYN